MDGIGKLLFMGLPETGKTTFLAAFWYLVDNKRSGASMILEELHGDREYLNNIKEKWISFTRLERTRLVNEPVVSMKLVNNNEKKAIELFIPDLSGETYVNQWLKRGWTKKYQDLVIGSKGALLFIHPEKIIEPTRIDQANPLVNEIVDENAIEGDAKSGIQEHPDTLVEWDPRMAPTQVQLVELLQFIEDFPETTFPFKLAIIISAWDLLDILGISPEEWVKKELPLLHQYLFTNKNIFPYKIFGVSAQGWPYKDNEVKVSACTEPADRIIIKCDGYNGKDLTKPVAWIMDENEL
jgi:hypothetical protein